MPPAARLAGIDMADMSAKVAVAEAENKKRLDLRRDAEKATEKRDLALGTGGAIKGTVEYYIKASRDILLGVHKGNEQTLGDWGFEVDTSARKAAKPATAARATV